MNDDLIRRRELLEHLHRKVRSGDDVNIDKEILGFPAVDAVEVVRCEDCKHSRERNKDEQRFLVEGVLICTSLDATDDCCNAVWPDHFCSYGVRREDND